MAYSEDHIALAAEYVLGTLDADERAQVETMMAVDTEFTAIVHAWEYRLGVLNQMVGTIEPRPIVWENIRSELARTDFAQESLALSGAPPPPPVPESSSFEPVLPQSSSDPTEEVVPQPSEAAQPGTAQPAPDAIPDIAPIFMPQV